MNQHVQPLALSGDSSHNVKPYACTVPRSKAGTYTSDSVAKHFWLKYSSKWMHERPSWIFHTCFHL